jgi:hypothetical protein
MKIGFTGVPPLEKIKQLQTIYPNAKWFDLDVPTVGISKEFSIQYIPETTCSVIQTILANSFAIKPNIIIAVTGSSKCDQMRFLLPIIERLLPDLKIIETENNDSKDFGTPISVSALPLEEKLRLITESVLNFGPSYAPIPSKPKAGFWGVPPYDFSILKLFPDHTHVFGWTRCIENKTPAKLELELHVEKDLPTVFFCQSFCAKNILAKELAHKHKGLYVEADGLIDNSTKAKIQAFLELRNCF